MALTTKEHIKEQVRRAGFDPAAVKKIKSFYSLCKGQYLCTWHEQENRKIKPPELAHRHKIIKACRVTAPGCPVNGMALMLERSGYTNAMLFKGIYWRFSVKQKNIILPDKEIRRGNKGRT